jgi:hypothetical protein
MLPKDGRAGRGVNISSMSSSEEVAGNALHLEADNPVGEDGDVSAYADEPAITASSSKLTLFFFFIPSSDTVSDASLGAVLNDILVLGDLSCIDTDGEDFKADLAGDTDRAGGSCRSPLENSTATAAK